MNASDQINQTGNRASLGGGIAVSVAYACWGLLTIFWNLLAGVDSMYILAHRILWSMGFMGLVVALTGRWPLVVKVLHSLRDCGLVFLCGVLITVNWGVYIYAVNNGHVLDASLGYFVEPVLVTLTGLFWFHEKLNAAEKLTFAFAVIGLVYITAASGSVPMLSLVIACSFAAYGALHKKAAIDPYVALFLETLFIAPFALAYAIWMDQSGQGAATGISGWSLLLLPAAGVVTSIPLLLFNIGVARIPYYASGILMYLNPSLQFMMGLCYFHEPLDERRLVAFVIIWIGIAFTVADKLWKLRRERRAAPSL